ncbi:MAG: polysaccharide deacetylase family protein [Bacteroidetes bacterium]|nr:polysaccharide deacetylase family protein [Bacteroidota bacterium]
MISKIPKFIQNIFINCEFKIKDSLKTIYLTFDDGPVPDVTIEVLNLLDKYNAKATFFCVAQNIIKHPEVFEEIKKRGHRLGNHTFHHLKGWKTKDEEYFSDIKMADELVCSNLFRPPYGRIKPQQFLFLRKKYRIILWSVISYDYNSLLSKRRVWKNVRNNITDNDIVLFHDNIKAKENMLHALNNTLSFFSAKGYCFKSIE